MAVIDVVGLVVIGFIVAAWLVLFAATIKAGRSGK